MSLADQQWCPSSVQVTVLQARGLRIKGKSGTNDAYAVMQVGKEKFQTSVVEKSVAPVWKEEAAFDLPPLLHGAHGSERGTLHVHVLHRALVGPDKLLGQAVINLLQLSEDRTRSKTEWFKLLDKTGKPDKDRGEVLLDIQFMRNNMTASMFDLSAAGKSRSRLGKFKDKVRGKKKESDSGSNTLPSFTQVLTDSEEEANGGEVAASKDGKNKKHKMKSLFSPKSNLQKNMSQSMSVLPGKNSTLSGSQSSGLNVDSSEGKKKFKFKIHKRSGSSDSKDSSSGLQKQLPVEQSNLCINGSHIYCEEPPTRTSRIGSNFSLASSGHGSMEEVPENSPPSVDSLRAVRQYSPWTEEEEEEVENIKEDESRREEEEERMRMEEEEKVRRQQEELERLAEEEERRRVEEQKVKREEEERIRREEEERERLAEEQKRLEEEERRRMEEEEEKRQREEEEKIRMEEERTQEERRRRQEEEEEERVRREEEHKLAEEKKRLEEEERRRIEEEERKRREEEERAEEERRQREKEEKVRKEKEEYERLMEEKRKAEDEKKRIETEERRKMMEEERMRKKEQERKQREEEERVQKEKEEYERLMEEKRKLEEEKERIEAEEKLRKEEEERIRMEEERMRKEEEEKRQEEEERMQREEEERIKKEELRRREEEERARKEKEEYERLMEEEKKRMEEERMRKEQERKQKEEEEMRRQEEEERVRKEREEYERLVEEKRKMEDEKKRIEAEEKLRKEEEERARMEEERRRQEEEERARKEREEYERLVEEKRKLEEEKERIKAEEKFRKEEEERARMEEERRRKEEEEKRKREEQERIRVEEEKRQREEEERRREEEERARKEKEEYERLEEERMKEEEQRRRIEEEERIRKEEQERIKMEEEKRRQEEEERARKEKEEMERLAEQRRREQEEEERMRWERKEKEEARRLEKEKLKQKKMENKDGQKAAGKKSKLNSSADVCSTNPFDENYSYNPFEEIPDSPPGAKEANVQQRCQSAVSSLGSKIVYTDEKELISAQREKRPAPQPPGRNQAEKPSQREQDASARHLGQITVQNKDKDAKTVSVPPQRSVQMIVPVSRSPADSKNDQSSTAKGTTVAGKHSKRPAPARPRSVEEEPKTTSTAETKPTVYGLNPFEDDEDENDAAPVCWPPTADKDAASQTKTKSSKVARAPPPPQNNGTLIDKNTEGGCVADDTVPDAAANKACDPQPEAVNPVQSTVEACVKKEGPPVAARRLQPVKPLNSVEQQSVSVVQGENKSTGIHGEAQDKAKVNDAGLKGPFSQLTQEELISLVLKQENQLSERDKKISELEQYIDNLLVRVIEEQPSILMSMNSLKKAA